MKRKPAPRTENTAGFRKRLIRPRQMKDAEIHHRRVEQSIAERQLFRVAFAKLDLGIAPSSFCDHSRGEVDPDNRCTASCGSRGHVTGSGRDIDYSCARFDAGGVEEWLYALYREVAEGLMILPRNTLPTAVLELAKGVGINHVRSVLTSNKTAADLHFDKAQCERMIDLSQKKQDKAWPLNTSRLIKNSDCRLLKKTQRRGARKIDERRRT